MKIKALKENLERQGIDYFLLPNSDEFFSEYLPQNQKRIQYLTGFTGSSAWVIFGRKKSYFFTDGRYILQAKQQLNLSEFEIINIGEKSLFTWLEENLVKGEKLALDAKLSSVNFVNAIKKIAPNLDLLNSNPVDEIWDNRPDATNSEVFSCEKTSGCSSKDKITQVLKNLTADALLITKPENLCWLLNIRAADIEFSPLFLSYGILYKNGEVELFKGDKAHDILDAYASRMTSEGKVHAKSGLTPFLIQTDVATTNYWLYQLLEKNNCEVVFKNCPIELLKSIKNEVEIAGAIKAHEADGLALTDFLKWLDESIKNGNKIDEIMAEEKLLEFRKKDPNFLYPSFASISSFASNGAVIHYRASKETNKCFDPSTCSGQAELSMTGVGGLYLIDSGGQYFGEYMGTTDVTRTVAIGEPSLEMIENFTRVLKGHIAIARAKFPRGTTGAQLDVLARIHLWQAGLNYDHGTGHGVGSFLSVHEGPCGISKRANQELLEGMIISNEPGFYKEGEYGIRIENLMLVEKFNDNFLQFKTLTLAPIDGRLVDFKMLTYPEKKWWNDYHERINKTLFS
jgi:Xaa-Pro aminopeptidase